MPKHSDTTVTWLAAPEEHDFPAAASFLSLIAPPELVSDLVEALRSAPTETFKAKDLLRAADLPLLPTSNPHVASDLAKVHAGQALSPVLMVRGDLPAGRRAVVADGYHRICASYYVDENTDIPVRLVALAEPAAR